ncbi:ATP-dependent DNA helicase RecG [Thalassocella blandensis]|nr:ATP-dependent DNA helicase RecG [Thalassocella blandensis]
MHSVSLQDIRITEIKGVGERLASVLAKLDIHSVQDMLFHLPLRYLDRTRITQISQLKLNTTVVIQGQVLHSTVKFGKRRSLEVGLEDSSGATNLRFYHFSAAQKNALEPGTWIRAYGEPRLGATGLEFYHPEYERVDPSQPPEVEQTLTPIYPLTDGIAQGRMRKLAAEACHFLKKASPQELLPEDINRDFGVHSLANALAYVHFPPADADVAQLIEGTHPYQQRLAFEELLAHFLVRQKLRAIAQQARAARIKMATTIKQQMLDQLPFTLTGAQQRVLQDIEKDLTKSLPMLRMVQGDVGSGKTLVAAVSALHVAASGYQVAVVAPTEILAEQHLHNFTQWLAPLGMHVVWLVGKLTAAKKRAALAAIKSGEAHVVVGTHALFQEDVHFARLGLAIIDEQHRFGVSQRLTLRKPTDAGETPHQLVMTATPIPRTLAMTAYSELDYSVIDELPPGRKPINTVLISQSRREQVIARIRQACAEGKQAYWVCPLVEDSETLSAANAEETASLLRDALQEFNVGLVHGRLKAQEKEATMTAFKNAELQLLVATTVIEVGVDVPNASLMIIENPERLGLAQLHQLRGRVGRGTAASHCVLLYGDKLSNQAKERLSVLRETNDGFVIAERDLQLRGPGELLGTRQTGDMQYRVADAVRDAQMIDAIQTLGREFIESENPAVDVLIRRWIGKNQKYANV